MKVVRSKLKCLVRNAVVTAICLSVSGVPAALAQNSQGATSPALAALSRVVRVSKAETVEPLTKLRQALLDLQAENSVDFSKVLAPYTDAYAGMIKLRNALQEVAGTLQERDQLGSEAFFTVVVAYYGFKGLLQVAQESAAQNNSFIGNPSLDALDLVLPAAAAQLIITFQSQQAAQAGLEVYDLSFKVSDAPDGRKKIALNAREAGRFRMGAFMAYPSEATARKAMVFQALKLVFAKQAMLNGYLYSTDKVNVQLPQGTDPALSAMLTHANAMSNEGAYRHYVTSSLLDPLASAVGSGRPNFTSKVHEFYQNVASVLGHRLDVNKVVDFIPQELGDKLLADRNNARLRKQAVDIIASKFIQLESTQRTKAIKSALRASPIYLTEMTRADLKAAIGDAIKVVVIELALVPIERAMMSLEELDPREQAYIFIELGNLAEEAFKPEMISEKVIADFEGSRKDFDVIASFRRYELSQKVIAAVDWLDGAKGILNQIAHSTTVPSNLLPRRPDPGMTLLAMKPPEETPIWAFEMIQSVGGKASKLSKVADRRRLEGVVRATPTQLLEIARDSRNRALDSVLGEIQAIHRDKVSFDVYRWRSIDARIRLLGKRVQSQAARKILLNFRRMNHLADLTSSTTLRDKVRDAFNELVERKVEGLDKLIAELQKGQAYIHGHSEFVSNLFAPAAERASYLRRVLSNADTYRAYIQVHIQEIQNTLPILFLPVKLPSRMAALTNNPHPAQLYEILSNLKHATNLTQAEVSVGRNLIGRLADDKIRKADLLAEPAESTITPQNLIVASMSGTRRDPSIEVQLMDWFVDLTAGGTSTPVIEDSAWPTRFLNRDVLPAYFDLGTGVREKSRRIMVSSLIGPFLKAAAVAGKGEVATLLDPATDHTKALVQSEAYRVLMAEAGDSVGEGLGELQKRVLKWKHRWEAVKRVTMKTQEIAHYIFYETLFLNIPAEGHMIAGLYMALSGAVDFVADVGMFIDYWDTYADLRPFSQSGALGKGLVAYSELEMIRREMHTLGEIIVNRAPMDLWFFTAVGHDVSKAVKQYRMQRKFKSASSGLNMEQLGSDIQKLSNAYENIGLDLKVKPDQFNRLYEAKARALAPKLKSDAAAKMEFARWVEAKKLTGKFARDYAQLFEALAQVHEQAGAGEPPASGNANTPGGAQ